MPLLLQTNSEPSWQALTLIILMLALLLSSYVLYQRYQSRRRLVERVAELEALSLAGRALVESELDLEALCKLIAHEAGKIIDNRTFQVGLFEESEYIIMYWHINNVRQETPQTFDLNENSGLVGWVRQNRQSLLINDFLEEMDRLPAKPRYISNSPPRSAIFLPLISGDEVKGIVAAQHHLPNQFSFEDLRRLTIFANQAASAIANAQLFAKEQERAAHLELVSRLARDLNRFLTIDALLEQVVELTKQTFGFEPVSIFLIDQIGRIKLVASSSERLTQANIMIPAKQGLVGTAVATGETVLSNRARLDERFVLQISNPPQDAFQNTRSEIVIPLIIDNVTLGALDIQSPIEDAFHAGDRLTLESLGAEVAVAIDRVRRIDEEQEQAWLTTAQLQVARTISQNPELDELITAVTRLTGLLTGTTTCIVLQWKESTESYQWRGGYYDTPPHQPKPPGQIRLGEWAALDAVHIGQEPLATHHIPRWLTPLLPPEYPSVTLTPLLGVNQQVGIMLTTPLPTPEGGGGRTMELLARICEQVGQAIDTAVLRIAQQEEAWVNTVLLQVAEAVNSRIELLEILDTIVRLVPMLVGVESTLVLIWDPQQECFRVGPNYGLNELGLGVIDTLAITLPELNRLLIRHEDDRHGVSYYQLNMPHWLKKAVITDYALAFPLNARGNLVGLLVVGTQDNNLGQRRLNILNGIAHQAATAVVNNQLYLESAERSRLEQELNVARNIQTSLIPATNPAIPACEIAAYWQAARQVSGDFYDFLSLANDRYGIVIADVADKGVPAALFMALSRTVLRTVAFNRKNPADTLIRVNQILDKDAQTDLFVTMFYAIWHPDTFELVYANGGHNPPLLIESSGKCRELDSDGIALGVLPEVRIESARVRLHPGDTIIFYTDGVTEAMNEAYDEFELDRLIDTALSVRHLDAPTIVATIRQRIEQHVGNTAQSDDITLLVMKIGNPIIKEQE